MVSFTIYLDSSSLQLDPTLIQSRWRISLLPPIALAIRRAVQSISAFSVITSSIFCFLFQRSRQPADAL